MGLGDLFSKEGRAERALKKNVARAANKDLQSPDRFHALEVLRDIGTVEATVGMLRRFDMTYDKSIEDEQEKNWVYDQLLKRGDTVVPACREYMKSANSYAWPLRLIEEVGSKEKKLETIDELMARHPAGYERDPSRKIQFISWVSELEDMPAADIAKRIVAYLEDVDEGVRFQTVGALKRHKDELARDPILERFVNPAEESLRLRLRMLELFADAGWAITGYRPKVEERLPEQFMLDAKGFVKKK